MSALVDVDHNVRREIVEGLRKRNIDCVTAFEDSANETDYEPLFVRATALGRILLTMDDDLIKIAADWLARGLTFNGRLRSSTANFDW